MDYKKAIEVLELRQGFSADELQKSYKCLAKKFHPDNNITGDEKKFMKIKDAYEFLSDSNNVNGKESDYAKTKYDMVCPVCNGNGWRREKVKTARGYIAQKVKCSFCNGLGRK